jgi:hypothetical protein
VSIPLALVFAVNFVVDPFSYRQQNLVHLVQDELSEHSHDRLYRLARFRHRPKTIVLLGDSRMQSMKEAYFSELGVDVANLAYGGGTLFEAIETFWFVINVRQPTHVIIGLPFNLWSEANDGGRVAEAIDLLRRPLYYYLSYYVLGVSMRNAWRNIIGDITVHLEPPESRAGFWDRQLGPGIAGFYARWREPLRLRHDFEEVVTYCRQHGIRVSLIIPPSHVALQRKVAEYGLEGEYQKYLKALSEAGDLLNLDVPSARNADPANFGDPFHAKPHVMREVTEEVVKALGLRHREGSAPTQ